MKFGFSVTFAVALDIFRGAYGQTCVVSDWSEWDECKPAVCTPCKYGPGQVGSKYQQLGSAPFPKLISEDDMRDVRGEMMTSMMEHKRNSIDAIVEHYKNQPGPDLTSQASECASGSAGGFPCDNIDLNWWKNLQEIKSGISSTNDNWGWKSPVSGNEYALVGTNAGTAFVKVENGEVVGFLPTSTSNSDWRDIKVYNTYAVIVSEAWGHGLQIFDLLQLDNAPNGSTFSATYTYTGFGSAHNVVVNEETSRVYAVGSNSCSGGLHTIDINDPSNPTFLGCFSNDYVHDAQCVIYRGGHLKYFGKEICFLYAEDRITIVDVTANPPLPISELEYSGVAYSHQGWLNCQMDLLFVDDELDEFYGTTSSTLTFIVDISSLEEPQVIKVYNSGIKAIDHNQYVCGAYVYQANYDSGLRILDASNARNDNFKEVAYFDVTPGSTINRFEGTWNAFPFFDSGKVVVNSISGGVGIVTPNLFSQKRTRSILTAPQNNDVCPLIEEERSCDSSAPISTPVAVPISAPVAVPISAPVAVPISAPVSTPPISTPVAVPISAPVSTPTNSGTNCRKWCSDRPVEWSVKCTWRKHCSGCPECTNSPFTPPTKSPAVVERCMDWCEGHAKEWWKKCTWNKCAACEQCSGGSNGDQTVLSTFRTQHFQKKTSTSKKSQRSK